MKNEQVKGFILIKKGGAVENVGPVFPVETPKAIPDDANSDGKYPAKRGFPKKSPKKSK